MNDSRDQKTAVIKMLAILGFFTTAALVVWLFVQGLRAVPPVFSSLASIAESVQNYRPVTELTIGMEKSIVNSGESFKLTWTDLKQKGTYRFRYSCTNGISIQVRGADNNLIPVPCTDSLSLPENVLGLFISINSDENRFVDVPFTVAFQKNDGTTLIEKNMSVTIVNASIPLATNDTSVGTTTAPTPVVTQKEEPKLVAPKPMPAPVTHTPIPKPIVNKPVTSSPVVLYTDLTTSFLGIGTMSGDTFVPVAKFDPNVRGGIKFGIRNAGTKTSGAWTFTALLPGGISYTSDPQLPLRSNEQVVFTLGFIVGATTDERTVHVTITAHEPTDTNHTNDAFTWAVGMK